MLRLLTYTHRVFSGQEALGYGFATQVSETPFNDALAHEIASKSPSAMVQAKKLLNAAPYADEADGFLTESILQDTLVGTKNQLESVLAGMQKRAGNFENYRE